MIYNGWMFSAFWPLERYRVELHSPAFLDASEPAGNDGGVKREHFFPLGRVIKR